MMTKMGLVRTGIFRIPARAIRQAPVVRSTQEFTLREYSSKPSQESKGSSGLPLSLGVLALAGPAAYYLIRSGPENVPHDGHPDRHGATSEAKQMGVSGLAKDRSLGQPPSTVDEASSRKKPEGLASISGKQEGLSNTTTDNPYINEPGKSMKGEGETETAKVKGTVSPKRPQV